MTDIQLALTEAPNRIRAGRPSRPSRLRQGKSVSPSFQTLRLLPRLAALTGSEAISGWCQITDQTRPLSPGHHDANHRAASTDRLCLRQQRSPCNSRHHERIRGAAPAAVPTKDASFWPI